MTEPNRVLHPTRLVVCCLVAGILFAVADLVLGLFLASSEDGLGRIARVGIVLAGHGALAGLALAVLGLVTRILGPVFRPIPLPIVRGALLVATILLAIGFVWINRDTLEGPRIKSHRFHGIAVIVLNVGGVLGLAIAVRLVTAFYGLASRGRVLGTVLALFAFAIAASAQVADAKVLVGLYPMMHAQLIAIALLGYACGLAFLFAAGGSTASWKGTLVALGLAALAFGGACGIRSLDTYRADASAVVIRGTGTRQISAYTEDVFARLVPMRRGIATPSISLDGLDDAAANQAASDLLDELLPGRETLNVVLIAMDTVRFDHVGFNGYERPTTPNVDRLAEDGWVFERAYAPYPTSNYSYSSVFNGLLPRATPVYSIVQKLDWTFPPETSMIGLVAKDGHRTIGVNSFNRATAEKDAWFGTLKDGFQVYNPEQSEAGFSAPEVTDSALRALGRERGKAPWLLWAHYLEPHEPYIPWPEFDFGPGIKDAYDAEIAKTDYEVGRLIEGIKAAGEYDRTVFIVFSDHGEEFEEHNAKFHNSSVYEQQIRIPFLIRIPGLKGRRIATTVNIVDIMPTVLALLKIDDSMTRHGRSLLPIMLDPDRNEPGISHAEFFLLRGGVTDPVRAVHEGSKKLIWRVRKNIYEMYDVDADPLERKNLIGEDDELEGRMLAIMAAMDARIDATHGATDDASDELAFARELSAIVDRLEDPIPANQRRTWVEFQKAVYDYMGDLTPQARYQLPEGELGRIAKRLEQMWELATDSSAKSRFLRMIIDFGQPESVEFLRTRLPDSGGHAMHIALALARLGDETGVPLLLEALKGGPSYPDNQEIACALVKLGRPEGLPWITPSLTSLRWPLIGQALDALVGVPDREQVGFGLRELATEGFWKPKPVLARLATALGPLADDPNCRRLLFRFAVDGDPTIRERAEEAMAKAGIPVAELDVERESLSLETDGDSAIHNRIYGLAFERFRAAIAASKSDLPGLEFRLARYLHHEGAETGNAALLAEARSVLEDLRQNGRSELDRELASRRLAAMAIEGAKPLMRDVGRFGAEISDVVLPPSIAPNTSFPIRFKIKNTGLDPWTGGSWQFAPELHARWRTTEGEVLEDARPPVQLLPPGGLLPGEELEIFMIGMPPSTRQGQVIAALEIVWEQPWTDYGDRAILWSNSETHTIGK